MKKKLFVFLCLFYMVFSSQNIFAYVFKTPFYDWAGENVYTVLAWDEHMEGLNVVAIIDMNKKFHYCFVFGNKSSAMELYQYLSRLYLGFLIDVIQTTKWEYCGSDNNWIFYKAVGFY